MSAPLDELDDLDAIMREARDALSQRGLRVDIRERWERMLSRAERVRDVLTSFRDRCPHCSGVGRFTRPLLKDADGAALAWPEDVPRQTVCPFCRGDGLIERNDGDTARWG